MKRTQSSQLILENICNQFEMNTHSCNNSRLLPRQSQDVLGSRVGRETTNRNVFFFKRKRGKHFFTNHTKKTWLDHDKSFCLPQQVALISTDDPIKCPIFGESFASIETKLFWKVRNRFVWEIMTTWMLEVDLQNSQFKNTSHVLRGILAWGDKKSAHS